MSPIEFDKRPGSAKGKWKRRNGEPVGPIKPPGEPVPAATMRVRMLQAVRSKIGTFKPGQAIELDPATARSWIGFGLAEQDKMIDSAPETK